MRPALVLCVPMLCLSASSASAATLTPDRACYRVNQIMELTVSGFPSGDLVSFFGDQRPLRGVYGPDGQETYIEGDGTAGVQAYGDDQRFAARPYALEAESDHVDADGNAVRTVADAAVRIIGGFTASASPPATSSRPARKVRYRVAGAVELTPVFLHVTRERLGAHPGKPLRRTVKLGTPTGPCGALDVRASQLGGMRARRGYAYSRTIDLSPKPSQDPFDDTQAGLGTVFVQSH
jgi:hypothetical protein